MNHYNYFSDIEELFARRRGRNLLLSPLDWALIEDWRTRGVPLRIVLNAIGKVFDSADRQPAKKRQIKSLTYCRDEVEAQYADWLASQIGKNGREKVQSSKFKVQSSTKEKTENESILDEITLAHLEKVSGELSEAVKKADGELRRTLEKSARDLAELKKNPQNTESLEKKLEKMDTEIDSILLQNGAADKLKSEIEKQIASYKNKMEREVYNRTFDLMLVKRLREQARIPRFGLFNL